VIGHHHRSVRTRTDERGVTIVLLAVALVAVVFIVAVVVDLGYTRGGASFDQSSADLAALAGGPSLISKKYPDACKDIIGYVNTNAPGISAIDATQFCTGFSTTTCSGGSVAQVTPSTTQGAYTVKMEFPVPDSAIADATFGKGKEDGLPCERIRVSITSREPSFFGGIGGKQEYSVTRTATVRGGTTQNPLIPALWLLDPVGCGVLNVQGGSKVYAGDVSDPLHINPGVITLDSDGSTCSTTNPTLVSGGQGTEIRALPLTGEPRERGEITLRALPFNATTCAGSVACDQSAIGTQILPQPIPAEERATRAPVDWTWNCKPNYPDYFGIAIKGCGASTGRGPYIDRLVSGIGTTGLPTGYQRWTSSHSCSPNGTITVTGNWWVDCNTPNGLSINNGTTVSFTGGNVVFNGGVKLNSGGVLNVNATNPTATLPSSCTPPNVAIPCLTSSSARAAFIYVRAGDWNLGGGTFNAKSTVVYLSPTSFLKGSGGSPPTWSAPTEGPFAGLSLWAEAPGAFTISGGAGVKLQGTFFTPFANELTLTGGGNWGQQNAQFISYRLKVSGGSNLTMAPDPTTAIVLPPAAATLIR
jgi:hypothetical protein